MTLGSIDRFAKSSPPHPPERSRRSSAPAATAATRRWLRGSVVITIAVAAGLVSAWFTPRGPVTTAQALWTMTGALLAGLVIGLVWGMRWAAVVAWAVFAVVFEIARSGLTGPTVDAIHLGSVYGSIAFVAGRLFHGVVVLLPLVLGATAARRLTRRPGRPGVSEAAPARAVEWVGLGFAAFALVALAWSLARPATTAPILGPDGAVVPGSIAELTTIGIGGHDQVVMIRGASVENPVLLYLAGGPGGTDLGAMRRDTGLEQDFVVVTWDQRGAGKSYPALDPTATFTLDGLVADTVELTNHLRQRFEEERIYLVGQSWGSTLGVLAAQRHPELFHAFVGVGQMVSQHATDVIFWEDTLRWAERTGDTGLAATLRRNGPPPYEEITDYEPVVSHEHDWNAYPELDLDNEMPAILFVPEYTLLDRLNAFRGFLDTNGTLYPQLQGLDFRTDVPQLDLPVYMVLGEHEARGRATLAEEWFASLDAPLKERVVFPGAGHRANFDQPARFAELMVEVDSASTEEP